MITLYQFEISPYCDKVRRALTYKGIEFQRQEMLFSQPEANRKVSPTHKFPVIEHDVQRACMHIYEDWADESLFTYDLAMRGLWEHNIPLLVDDIFKYETPELQKTFAENIPGQIRAQLAAQGIGRKDSEAILRDVRRHVAAVNALVEHEDWLLGREFSYADIAVRAMSYVIDRAKEGAEMLSACPAIRDWEARVDSLTLAAPTS